MKNYLRKHLQKHKVYQSARQEFDDISQELILLDANENPFDLPYSRYPDPMQKELCQAIAEWRNIPLSQVFLGNGSDEIINQLIVAFCEPQEDKILIFPPTFGMYKVASELYKIERVEVPLTEDFQLDMPAILQSISADMKMCFVPTPNNPTGNRFETKDLQLLAKEFPGILVIDEAYAEFSPEESALSWLADFPNVICLQTFSKAQGMAGARLGMAFGAETIIEGLLKVKAPYHLNLLTVAAAIHQVKHQQNMIRDMVQLLVDERERIISSIKDLSFIERIYPSDANFFMMRVDDASLRYQQLIQKNIVVRNASKNLNCENCLRVSIGTPDENTLFIKALNEMA